MRRYAFEVVIDEVWQMQNFDSAEEARQLIREALEEYGLVEFEVSYYGASEHI